MNILNRLENEFNIKREFLQNTVNLLDEGNTIPFIARYRKELTGSLDDQVLRELSERLSYLRNLDETREKYRESIQNSGALTPEICSALENAETLAALEDIYRPFRPKRRTRATIAVEKGLQPLADLIFAQNIKTSAINIAADFINEEKGVFTAEDALSGGKDIIAEVISDNAKHRAYIRKIYQDKAYLSSVAADPEKQSVYEMYYEFRESVKKIAGHRVLAVNRGEKEEFLKVKIEAPDEDIINVLNSKLNLNNIFTREIIEEVLRDSYKRLIQPSIEREIRNELTEKSEEGAIKVFGANLKQLLLQPPVKNKTVIALDPGIRTGCKVAVLDGAGKPLDTAVIYPVSHGEKTLEQAKITLKKLIETYNADILAIGNGTASRETEAFAAEVIKQTTRKTYYAIVNEAGASVYSASKLGAEEFPNYDVTLRSAVSIGRRLQDPLAELVKIDPKSIGVGQYQHDMNQKKLSETLAGIVEACVNTVGVDLNTASPALLSYVAGISAAVAKNILTYREENGIFTDRKQLLKVKKLGPKAYEQCAGFLRIPDGTNPLDNTAVHPESYSIVEKILQITDMKIGKKFKFDAEQIPELAEKIGVGVPTLSDIIRELEKPGRDIRDEAPPVVLRSDVLSIEHLTSGMELKGIVRNVIDFGVFVDIGVHQDGLVHISQITDKKFIKHPLEVVSVGDVVDVRVMSVDIPKKRISLTMRK